MSQNERRFSKNCEDDHSGGSETSLRNEWIQGIVTRQMHGNSFVWLASGFGGDGRCQDEALLAVSSRRGHEEVLTGDFIRCKIEIRPTPAGSSHRYPEQAFVYDFYGEDRPFGWQFGGCSDNGQAKIICPLKFVSMLHRTVRGKYGIYGNELLREVHDFDHLASNSREIEQAIVQRTRIPGMKGNSGWFISKVLSGINPQRSIERLPSGMNFASNYRSDLLLDPADPPSSDDRTIQHPASSFLPTSPAEVRTTHSFLTPTHMAPPEPVNARTSSTSTEYVVTKGFVVKTWGAFRIVWTPENLAILCPDDLPEHNDTAIALGAFVRCTIARLTEPILDRKMEYRWHVIHWEPRDDIKDCRAVIEGDRAQVCAEIAFTGYQRANSAITNQHRESFMPTNRVAHYSHSFFEIVIDRDGKIMEPAPGCTFWVILKAVPIDERSIQWIIARKTSPLTSSEDKLVSSKTLPSVSQRRASAQSSCVDNSFKGPLNDLIAITSTQSTGSTVIQSGRVATTSSQSPGLPSLVYSRSETFLPNSDFMNGTATTNSVASFGTNDEVVALLSDFVESSGESEARCYGAHEPKPHRELVTAFYLRKDVRTAIVTSGEHDLLFELCKMHEFV